MDDEEEDEVSNTILSKEDSNLNVSRRESEGVDWMQGLPKIQIYLVNRILVSYIIACVSWRASRICRIVSSRLVIYKCYKEKKKVLYDKYAHFIFVSFVCYLHDAAMDLQKL